MLKDCALSVSGLIFEMTFDKTVLMVLLETCNLPSFPLHAIAAH